MKHKTHASKQTNLTITGVPVSNPQEKNLMPADSESHTYVRAQQLKPCIIPTLIDEIQNALRNSPKLTELSKNGKQIKKEVAKASVSFVASVNSCKEASLTQRMADYSNMPPGDLREKADKYRKEVTDIRRLQSELIEKINNLPELSRDVWEKTKELAGLDPTKNTYRYDVEEHVMYLITPDCTRCKARKEIQRNKRTIIELVSTLEEEKEDGGPLSLQENTPKE